MKFLADDNIPLDVVKKLKSNIDIEPVSESGKRLEDEEILLLAKDKGRVIITFDKDYGELLFRHKKESNGVILLRVIPKSPDYIYSVLKKVINLEVDFTKTFCVVEIGRVRMIPIKE